MAGCWYLVYTGNPLECLGGEAQDRETDQMIR